MKFLASHENLVEQTRFARSKVPYKLSRSTKNRALTPTDGTTIASILENFIVMFVSSRERADIF